MSLLKEWAAHWLMIAAVTKKRRGEHYVAPSLPVDTKWRGVYHLVPVLESPPLAPIDDGPPLVFAPPRLGPARPQPILSDAVYRESLKVHPGTTLADADARTRWLQARIDACERAHIKSARKRKKG